MWIHAASVGEGLHALPLIQRLRVERPDVQIAYTHYSPSAEEFSAKVGADFYAYLPFDTQDNASAILDALRPSLIIFSKLDVWPSLAKEAHRRGVKLALTSATLPEQSMRATALGRMFLGGAYKALDIVGAIDEQDAERLIRLGVRKGHLHVTGDLRYDQVWVRVEKARSSTLIKSLASKRPTLVAGSTWPTDEKPLLNAWMKLRNKVKDARLIIAPHEIKPKYITSIQRWAKKSGLTCARVSQKSSPTADVVIADSYGILADLYALADASYVGGGYHNSGLHSVVEPAAFGAPVLFGPRHTASRDALLLIREGGGIACQDEKALCRALLDMLANTTKHQKATDAAKRAFLKELGAADKTYKLISELLPPQPRLLRT